MNSRFLSRNAKRLLALHFLCLATVLPGRSQGADFNIDQLMRSLPLANSGRATFVEKKFIAMLKQPVVSTGILIFRPPDHFEKLTVKPDPESMRVSGNEMALQRGGQRYTIQLQHYPELAGFIDSLRGTLAGNRAALDRSFSLDLEGNIHLWTLVLFPKDSTIIEEIRITGGDATVRSILVIQTDGDRSLMTIDRIAN